MCIDLEDPTNKVKIGKLLTSKQKEQLTSFLKVQKEVFVWTHQDMSGINTAIIMHRLNVDPKAHPVKQNRRAFNPERYEVINEEVEKLKSSGAI